MGQMELNEAKARLMNSYQGLKQELLRRQMDELQTILGSGSLSTSERNELEAWNRGLISPLEDLPSEGQEWRLGPSLQAVACSPVPITIRGQRIRIVGDLDQWIIPLDAGPGRDWPLPPPSTAIDPGEGGDWYFRGLNRLNRPLRPTDDSGEGSVHHIPGDSGEGVDWGGRGSLKRAGRLMRGGEDIEGRIIGLIIDRSKMR